MSSISTWTKREIVWESVRRNAHYKRDYEAFRTRFDPWFAEKGIRKGIDPWVSTVFDAQFFKQLSAEDDIRIFFELLRWLRAFRIQWLFAGPPLDPRMDRSEFPNSEYPRLILALILPHPDPEENETGFVKDPFEPLPIEELVRQIRQHERESRKSRSILKNGIRRIEKHLRTQSNDRFTVDPDRDDEEDILRYKRFRRKVIMSSFVLSALRGSLPLNARTEERLLEFASAWPISSNFDFDANEVDPHGAGRPAGRRREDFREDFRTWDESQKSSLRELVEATFPNREFDDSLERQTRRQIQRANDLIEGKFRKL